jgi:thiol-disulfide isomerase/thioredoxin
MQTVSDKKRKSMAKIRTEVFIETSEIFIIKRNRNFPRTWCEDCEREVRMVTLSEAAFITGYDVKAIHSMMENRHVHFINLNSETPSVCLRSLCLF